MSAANNTDICNPNRNMDFYSLLHCNETSSVAEIEAAYETLILQNQIDKNNGHREADEMYHLLKEAKLTLCDPQRRSMYNKWRNGGAAVSYKKIGTYDNSGQVRRYTIAEKVEAEVLHSAKIGGKEAMLSELGEMEHASPSRGILALASNPTQRRSSEGGAGLYYGNRKVDLISSNTEAPRKFRNNEI